MTEEEYFRKNYPDSCYGDKPLSPHWDFFQDGVEFGERQSEKKIAKLERRIASIRGSHRVDLAKLNARIEQVERLKKENAELKRHIKADCIDCADYYKNKRLGK